MVIIWTVWWISEKGDTPEITVFVNAQRAHECYEKHKQEAYECDIDEYQISLDEN